MMFPVPLAADEQPPAMPCIRLTALLLTLPTALYAAGAPTYNEAALMRGVALPAMDGGRPAGWSLQFDLTNDFVLQSNADESLRLDGESLVARIHYRHRWPSGWDAGVTLPLVWQGGGFMDRLIEDWHDFFGLPNAGRERRPNDEFVYFYERDGNTVVDIRHGRAGLADSLVWLGRELGPASVRLGLKLPTGDEAALLGSGKPGAALWVERPYDDGRWFGHAAAGISWSRAGGALAQQRVETLPIGSASIGWRALRELSLLAQLSAHGQAFRGSRLDALNKPGVQLALGGRFIAGGTEFTLLFQEDVVTASSPDFSLHLSWAPTR